jgi:hypothetical protein
MLLQSGSILQQDADRMAGLAPGEHLMRSGVINGAGAHPGIPRFGADETDNDHVGPAVPGAQDEDWVAYWAGKPVFRDVE